MIKPPKKYQSPESLVLRFMREKRQLSLPEVAKKIGLKAKVIDLFEKGEKPTSEAELLLFLDCYQFSSEIYTELLAINPLNKQTSNFYFISRKIY